MDLGGPPQLVFGLFIFTLIRFRYKACKPRIQSHHGACSERLEKQIVFAVFAGSLLLCVPNFIYFTPLRKAHFNCYMLHQTELAMSIPHFSKVWFWYQCVVFRTLPSLLLLIFTLLIVGEIRKISKLGRVLNRTSTNEVRATKMLMTIIICTIVAEIPKIAIPVVYRLKATSSMDSWSFESQLLEHSLNGFLEIFLLLNSSINFIIYCSMSKYFRETCKDMIYMTRVCVKYRHMSRTHVTQLNENEALEMNNLADDTENLQFEKTCNDTFVSTFK